MQVFNVHHSSGKAENICPKDYLLSRLAVGIYYSHNTTWHMCKRVCDYSNGMIYISIIYLQFIRIINKINEDIKHTTKLVLLITVLA